MPNSKASLGSAKRDLRVLYAALCALLLLGLAGAVAVGGYVGAAIQSSRDSHEWAGQKLDYEKRLGTQSAQYAKEANTFAKAVESFGKALSKMDAKNDLRSAQRERAQAAALLAAQRAAASAAVTAQKTDQILAKQTVVQQQVTEAASAAKATEKKLDTAVRPTAVVPARAWTSGGGH